MTSGKGTAPLSAPFPLLAPFFMNHAVKVIKCDDQLATNVTKCCRRRWFTMLRPIASAWLMLFHATPVWRIVSWSLYRTVSYFHTARRRLLFWRKRCAVLECIVLLLLLKDTMSVGERSSAGERQFRKTSGHLKGLLEDVRWVDEVWMMVE